MAKKLAIVGYAPNRLETPFEDDSIEIAFMNDLWLPMNWPQDFQGKIRFDYLFDMHHPDVMRSFSRSKEGHWDFLKGTDQPVITLEQIPEIPTSVAYPLDEVMERFGTKYFTSTVAYQLAWAAIRDYDEVHIYGVNFIGREEYEYQRACTEYWIGLLRGMGIKVHVPETSCLLQSGFLYGYETHVLNKNVGDNLNALFLDKSREIEGARLDAAKKQIRHEGQLEVLHWVSDIFGHVNRGGFIPGPEKAPPAKAYEQQREDRNVESMRKFRELAGNLLREPTVENMRRAEAAAAILMGLPDDRLPMLEKID
jgi:hypothetical protein